MNAIVESGRTHALQWSVVDARSALACLDQFDELIDVRSPAEYAIDCLPGATNLPVLSDDQRAEVGKLHKLSPFEARRSGAALVAQNIALHLQGPLAERPRHWRPLIYCWRGGGRSSAMTHVLERVGWPVRQLQGGYKAWRALVLSDLQNVFAPLRWCVIGGPTGCGKTRLLEALRSEGAQVLDLESLACHRGSVLGGLPDVSQPSQKAFESTLWWTVRRFDPNKPVYVESESRKIGVLALPLALTEAMRKGLFVQLEVPMTSRVAFLRGDYGHFEADPKSLHCRLDALAPFHGLRRIAQWRALIEARRWDDLVECLLNEHYDTTYSHSLTRNYGRRTNAIALTPLSLPDLSRRQVAIAARNLINQVGD